MKSSLARASNDQTQINTQSLFQVNVNIRWIRVTGFKVFSPLIYKAMILSQWSTLKSIILFSYQTAKFSTAVLPSINALSEKTKIPKLLRYHKLFPNFVITKSLYNIFKNSRIIDCMIYIPFALTHVGVCSFHMLFLALLRISHRSQ